MRKNSRGSMFLGAGLAACTVLAASGFARAAEPAGEQLAREKGCFSCHSVGTEMIGPSFRDIARRFAGLNNAKPMLARVVTQGTSNGPVLVHWGTIKMPPGAARSPVSDAEADEIVDYILSLHHTH